MARCAETKQLAAMAEIPEEPRKIRDGALWAWQWNGWISVSFAFLEERPWSPIIVEDRLCFVACDCDPEDPEQFETAKWCVVWGDRRSDWFDDVANLSEHDGVPVFIARKMVGETPIYLLVRFGAVSQAFDAQITYIRSGGQLMIRPFHPTGGTAASIKPVWQITDH